VLRDRFDHSVFADWSRAPSAPEGAPTDDAPAEPQGGLSKDERQKRREWVADLRREQRRRGFGGSVEPTTRDFLKVRANGA
jgi:hypothetical protein